MTKQPIQKNHIFANYKTDSPEAIEFRRIFAKIKNLNNSNQIKKVMVTSSINGEGKSSISIFLAITCARLNKVDTILVDCDLRLPQNHKILEIEKKRGLAEILAGEIDLFDAIKNTNIKKLKVITSGLLKISPTNLVSVYNIKNLFTKLQWLFETIIIDTPPILPVNDALILSAVADTTLLVIKAEKTQKEVVKRASELIQDAGIKKLGILVNNYNNVLPYYYNYKYHK